jgi:iron complex outermembrane receptor protein
MILANCRAKRETPPLPCTSTQSPDLRCVSTISARQAVNPALGTTTLRLDSSYVDDHYFEIFNVDRMQEDGYWVHNARLQFDSSDEDWSVALWVKNLADEEYRSSGIDLQASFGYDYSHIGAPRTYGAEFTYRF